MAYLSSLFYPVSTVVSGYSSFTSNSNSFSNFLLVKASAGTLYTLTGYTSSVNTQYIQIYNGTTYPPTGSPVSTSIIPGPGNFDVSFNNGLPLSAGVLIVCSTTPVSFTSAGINTFFTAVYK